jgi:hypothetical protein
MMRRSVRPAAAAIHAMAQPNELNKRLRKDHETDPARNECNFYR